MRATRLFVEVDRGTGRLFPLLPDTGRWNAPT